MNVCVPNIGRRERQRRLVGGIVMLAVAAGLAGGLMLFGAPRWWRLLVLLPAWGGALGLFQVRAKTCVALAARGLRNMDAGDEAIANPRELDQVRAQSRQVHVRAALSALALTALIVMLP
jgi:hypothetical protein